MIAKVFYNNNYFGVSVQLWGSEERDKIFVAVKEMFSVVLAQVVGAESGPVLWQRPWNELSQEVYFFHQHVPLALQNARRKTTSLGQICLNFIMME